MFSGEITGLKPPGNHGFHVHQVFDGDGDGDDDGDEGDLGDLIFSGGISGLKYLGSHRFHVDKAHKAQRCKHLTCYGRIWVISTLQPKGLFLKAIASKSLEFLF